MEQKRLYIFLLIAICQKKYIALEQTKDDKGEETPLLVLGGNNTIGAHININIDGNNIQKINAEVRYCKRCVIDVHTYNFTEKGFYNHINVGNDENIFNVWAYGVSYGADYGVYNISGDSVFNNIICVDCKTAVYTNVILKAQSIHAWLTNTNFWDETVVLEVANSWARNICHINWFYQDGVKIGVYSKSDCNIIIDLFNYYPYMHDEELDQSNYYNVQISENTTVDIRMNRCNSDATYDSMTPLKYKVDDGGCLKLGDTVGELHKGQPRYNDIDSLPDVGNFMVNYITAPISASSIPVFCSRAGNIKRQIIHYGGYIYYRVRDYSSQSQWGIWKKLMFIEA